MCLRIRVKQYHRYSEIAFHHKERNKAYSKEFKEIVVNEYLNGNGSLRDLLSEYGFDGDETPVIRGSAYQALQGDANYEAKINELMAAVYAHIPDPTRDVDKPFLMSVEDVMTITGRGTVATGCVERGIVKLNEEVEIVE